MRTTAFLLLLLIQSFFAQSQQFTVTLKAPQYNEGISYLIYYYGKNLNVEDSAAVNDRGVAVFSKKSALTPGVYSVVLPGKRVLFDFLVDGSQKIDITIPDTANLLEKTIVQGSKENDLFAEYQKEAAAMGALMQKESEAYKNATTEAEKNLHQENYGKYNRDLNNYRRKIMEEYPESMLTTLLKAMKEPEVLHKQPRSRQDSLENYEHYKKHYWDGITFMDARIIRTPFFLPKLEKYFREVISPNPDSTIKEVEHLLLLSRSEPEMFKFLLNWFTDEYINPKYMGQDKVFVHLFEKYHSKGVSDWLNEKQQTAISNRAYMVMSNLIGEKAANLEMTSTKETPVSLYGTEANYTVVVFWDPTCGHCRTEMPQIDSLYKNKWKNEGVKIFAVLTDHDQKAKWQDFIKEHQLDNWINVYESDAQQKAVENSKKPSFRQLYDVIQTPTIYLLDKDKRIIAKKLSLEQMDEMIETKVKADSSK